MQLTGKNVLTSLLKQTSTRLRQLLTAQRKMNISLRLLMTSPNSFSDFRKLTFRLFSVLSTKPKVTEAKTVKVLGSGGARQVLRFIRNSGKFSIQNLLTITDFTILSGNTTAIHIQLLLHGIRAMNTLILSHMTSTIQFITDMTVFQAFRMKMLFLQLSMTL